MLLSALAADAEFFRAAAPSVHLHAFVAVMAVPDVVLRRHTPPVP